MKMRILTTEFFTFREYISREGMVGIKVKEGITMNGLMNARYLLNLLVMCRFRLEPYAAVDGGLIGKNVRLINPVTMTLGLTKDISLGLRTTSEEKKILCWYSEIINYIFLKGNEKYPDPSMVWFDPRYENNLVAKFSLLRSAVIDSDWDGKDVSYKENFFDITFIDKISEATRNHLLSSDYLVPARERGILKETKQTTFISKQA